MRISRGEFKRHLTFANVASSLALFLAIGGAGAYASGLIGSDDIKDNAIKSRHIAAHQVKAIDIADGAITGDAGTTDSVGAPPPDPYQVDTDNVVTLSLSRPARIVVIGKLSLGAQCDDSGPCDVVGGIYVNDAGLPGTENQAAANASEAKFTSFDLRAVSSVLPTGTYHVRAGFLPDQGGVVGGSATTHFVAFTIPG